MMWLYIGLAILRVVWSVLPQHGYIHPDEFFQSVEVTAGDAFNISVERTWEFDEKMPLRTMIINKILFMPLFLLLHQLSSTVSIFTVTGRLVLSSSRLMMACFSFVLDYNVLRVCKLLNLDGYTGLLILSSSYVMLTFQTHSFSNSVESVLLSCVVTTLIQSFLRSATIGHVKKEKRMNYNKTQCQNVTTIPDARQTHDSSRYNFRHRKTVEHPVYSDELELAQTSTKMYAYCTPKHVKQRPSIAVTIQDCVVFALLNTLGIFNRPTFALFSIAPFVWWCNSMRNDKYLLVKRVGVFTITSVLCAVVFCILDTCYYRDLALTDILIGNKSFQEIVMTPWNFIQYNINASNLDQHGRHPFYLHFLVNIPLLFGPLALIYFKGVFTELTECGTKLMKSSLSSETRKDANTSVGEGTKIHHYVLLIFISVPVALLSIFPHQEARFLIPVLPLVILYSLHSKLIFKKTFIQFFLVFNITLSILFGALHQGGVIPCLFKLQELSTLHKYSSVNTTVLFSHTYMPPKHLLLLKETSNMTLVDLKGGNFNIIRETIMKIHQESDIMNRDTHKLILVLPGTIFLDLKTKLDHIVTLTVEEKFFPHLTLDDPPKFTYVVTDSINQLSLFWLTISHI